MPSLTGFQVASKAPSPAGKQLYYVIRRRDGKSESRYARTSIDPAGGFSWTDLNGAQRFSAVAEVLTRFGDRDRVYRDFDRHQFQIIRVEETAEPGSTSVVEVPLGDPRQTGVVVKAGTAFWNREPLVKTTSDVRWVYDIAEAFVFENVALAVRDLQDATLKWTYRIVAEPTLVGVATVTTAPKVTRNEIVLA